MVFAGRRPRAAVIGWVIAVALFALIHPIAGDGSEARAFTTAHVLSGVGCAALGMTWYRRTLRPATSAHFALAMIVTAEVISLLGAWRIGPYEGWLISQVLYLLMLVVVIVVQGRFLWSSPQSQPSSA